MEPAKEYISDPGSCRVRLSDKLDHFAADKVTRLCEVCKEHGSKKCALCGARWYCGKECQRRDWPKHKGICAYLKEQYEKTPFSMGDLDWLLWEKVDTAHRFVSEGTIKTAPLTEGDLNFLVIETSGPISLIVPFRIGTDECRIIQLEGPVTLRVFMETLYSYYNTPITDPAEIAFIRNIPIREDIYSYIECFINRALDNNQPVRYLDLMGLEGLYNFKHNRKRRLSGYSVGQCLVTGVRPVTHGDGTGDTDTDDDDGDNDDERPPCRRYELKLVMPGNPFPLPLCDEFQLVK
jgi:hypothetical protein